MSTIFQIFEEELDDTILTICEKYGFDYLDFNAHTPKEGLRDITQHKDAGESDDMLYSVIEYKDRMVGTITTNDFVHTGNNEQVWYGGVFRGNRPENRFMKLMKDNKLIQVSCALKRRKRY